MGQLFGNGGKWRRVGMGRCELNEGNKSDRNRRLPQYRVGDRQIWRRLKAL